ncbi:hypothetical protein [Streptomyces candidus]|uniref:Uncharacterized protein n=1 Tax=Streptomyces candidus TaxID=67283 RepID=A0A7X0LTA0_9ACTN|nr:hypothetical protein [Streptomyces candidus]MBB6440115.1 hypothetical protein [Streptomyces candidus]GHH58392.1 hypothetical protein GCM10018773_66550 [Streptomyces candidus]
MNETPASGRIPLRPGSDGRPYIEAELVVDLLRAMARTHRNLADDPDCDLLTAAAAIDQEADALSVNVMLHTR